jgi:hypothetical protein
MGEEDFDDDLRSFFSVIVSSTDTRTQPSGQLLQNPPSKA